MLGRILSSQSRQITVWFYEPYKVCYVIPMFHGLESSLGANLEVQLDLRKSYQYQQRYKYLSGVHQESPLPSFPRFQTPLLLSVSSRKSHYKTVLEGIEESPEPLLQENRPYEQEQLCEKEKQASLLLQ